MGKLLRTIKYGSKRTRSFILSFAVLMLAALVMLAVGAVLLMPGLMAAGGISAVIGGIVLFFFRLEDKKIGISHRRSGKKGNKADGGGDADSMAAADPGLIREIADPDSVHLTEEPEARAALDSIKMKVLKAGMGQVDDPGVMPDSVFKPEYAEELHMGDGSGEASGDWQDDHSRPALERYTEDGERKDPVKADKPAVRTASGEGRSADRETAEAAAVPAQAEKDILAEAEALLKNVSDKASPSADSGDKASASPLAAGGDSKAAGAGPDPSGSAGRIRSWNPPRVDRQGRPLTGSQPAQTAQTGKAAKPARK